MRHLLVLTGLMLLFASPVRAATLSLNPTNLNLNSGNQTTLVLHLDPQGAQVIGSDIFLNYPKDNLKVISVVNRQVFPGNPATVIDNDHGVTKFSLINNFGVYQTAPDDIATITVEGLNAGDATIGLTMSPGSTTDTNVVTPGGADVLTSVTNAHLSISYPSDPSSPTPTLTPSPTDTPAPTPTPTEAKKPKANQDKKPDNGDDKIKNLASPGFVSPLPDPSPTPKPNGYTLGAVQDLTATPQEARSLLIFLLPSLLALTGLALLVSVVRSYRKPQLAPVVIPRRPSAEPTLTFYHQ